MPETKQFYIGARGQNFDNDFKIKDISFDKESNEIDIAVNHLYLSLHPDYARQLAEGILRALEQTKTPFDEDKTDEEVASSGK